MQYILTNSWIPSSKALAYVYDRENFADNVITTTRLVNKMTFADGKGLQNNVTINGQPKGITKRRYHTGHSNKYQRTQLEQS